MRALARPFLLFACLCTFTAISQSQPAPPGRGGINLIQWGTGSPAPTTGGVDVTVTIQPTTGWTCTELLIRVINADTAMTLAEHTTENPGASVSKSFTGLGSNVKLRVTADATFQNGPSFDFKDLEAFVTTK